MFSGMVSKAGVRENTSAGLWAVHCSTPQFWAWKDWLYAEMGYDRRVLGKGWLTVWGEWPPATPSAACRVAQAISDMRDELHDTRLVPRRPEPWDGQRSPVPEEYRNKSTD